MRWIADIDNLEFLIEGDHVGSLPYNLDLHHSLAFAILPRAMGWVVDINWRYTKSEWAMERPRVWTWERREKLLPMVTLVDAFLLALASEWQELESWLLRTGCHRTGKRSREVAAPLFRLRSALSRLWQAYL